MAVEIRGLSSAHMHFPRDHQCLSLVAPRHCGSPQPQPLEGLIQQVWDRAQVSAFF